MWKTIGGRCIYHTPSGAKVHQNFLYRWLTFESSAIQTLINRRYPAKPKLRYIHHLTFAARIKPDSCCLLGLGGGSVAHTLSPFLTDFQLHIVENNADVIHIAANYFMINQLKNLEIIQQDANEFVHQATAKYQHLMVDLFDAHSFPLHCNTIEFFNQCRHLLAPNGILAVNLANLQEQWPVFNHISACFKQRTVALPVKGTANIIILALNGPALRPLLDLLNESGYLKKLYWNAKWGCVAHIN
jgi:spermidine synthase